MPENKTIHDLPIAEQTSSSDVFETEIPSQLMQSGYASRKVSAAEIADLLLNDMTYPQALQTTAKKIIPAINEAAQSGGGGASVVQKTMAEYTALPSTDKMNGSIYKITDKALIYCLDEEYHALKELTSAQYSQLTPAEQNNGTIYVKTDEETTADDIPYSSGVSVADMLDSNTTDDNYLVPVYNNEKVLKITETSTAYYISGYVRVNGNVAANTKLYTFAKNIVKSEFFLGFIGTAGCRVQIDHTDKSLKTLDAIADKQYLNFSAYAIKE